MQSTQVYDYRTRKDHELSKVVITFSEDKEISFLEEILQHYLDTTPNKKQGYYSNTEDFVSELLGKLKIQE